MKNFFEDIDNKVEYKYRCLVYPNITYQKDFTKDSYYIIILNLFINLPPSLVAITPGKIFSEASNLAISAA